MDKSNRKRFNSSMNYKEYVDLYQMPPPKPVIRFSQYFIVRPSENTPSAIPEFDLDADLPVYEQR